MKIIAELCQNHNGNVDVMHQMIDAAADAGATHVKIQNIRPDILAFRPRHEEGIKIKDKIYSIKRPYIDEYRRLDGLTLSDDSVRAFIDHCRSISVVPLTTCFSRQDISSIARQGFSEIKIASYDCSSYVMLKELKDSFSHIYISTGATYDREVLHAKKILDSLNCEYTFLQCTTIYPTPIESTNLQRINFLRKLSKDVGFSDHSKTVDESTNNALSASKLALYSGANVIERHFTILPPDQTKDGKVSVDPTQLKELVEFSQMPKEKQYEVLKLNGLLKYLNDGDYKTRDLSDEELLNRDYYKGRFASVRHLDPNDLTKQEIIYNWEEGSF